MSKFTKKVLLAITPQMYSEVISLSKKHGQTASSMMRLALIAGLQAYTGSVSKPTTPQPSANDVDLGGITFED